MSLLIKIGDTDYSGLMQYTGRSETMRRVEGPNTGIAMDGSDIYDDLATKYDLTLNTYPLKAKQLYTLINLLSATTLSVQYYSVLRNKTVTQTMRCSNINAIVGALKLAGTEAIIQNVQIQLKQQ